MAKTSGRDYFGLSRIVSIILCLFFGPILGIVQCIMVGKIVAALLRFLLGWNIIWVIDFILMLFKGSILRVVNI